MAKPEIERINCYNDGRFSKKVLRQHGAFLVNGQPYEIEITSGDSALVRGASPELYTAVIEDFRFYAEHICKFYNGEHQLITEYPPVELFSVKLEAIQPSQFYVDKDKLAAVRTFISSPEDIVIPVTPAGERYISQDGHTRLAAAVQMGFGQVMAFTALVNDSISGFVEEAQKRGVYSPTDLQVIPHAEYKVKWNQFCDEYFQRQKT